MAECCFHVLGLSLLPVQPLQKPQSQRDRKKHREKKGSDSQHVSAPELLLENKTELRSAQTYYWCSPYDSQLEAFSFSLPFCLSLFFWSVLFFSLSSHILRRLISNSLKVTATLVIKAVDVKPEVAS